MPAREQSQLPTLVTLVGPPLTNPPRKTPLHHCPGESLTKLFVRPGDWLVRAFPKWPPANSGGLGPRIVPGTSKSARGCPSRKDTSVPVHPARCQGVELLILWITGFASPPNLDAQRRSSQDPLQKTRPLAAYRGQISRVSPPPCPNDHAPAKRLRPELVLRPLGCRPLPHRRGRHAPRSGIPTFPVPPLSLSRLTSAPDPTRAAGTLPLQNTTLSFYTCLG